MALNTETLTTNVVETVATYGMSVVGGIALLIGGYIAAGWVAGRVKSWCDKHDKIDQTLEPLFVKASRMAVMAVAIVAVLNQFGVQTASIIALLGSISLAVGLALQGSLSNAASGIMLLFLRPFDVGDVVEAAGATMKVTELSLLTTSGEDVTGVLITLPNTAVLGGAIKNLSRKGIRRVDMVFGIGYEDDMDKALKILMEIIAEDPRVLDEPEPTVGMSELADSSVNFFCRPWVKGADYWGVKGDVTKKVKQRFDEAGLSIPFPQTDIHVHQIAS